jgi:predicted 2-oxoglutarate/Fe(II)-dependent dioxygenase YbiX
MIYYNDILFTKEECQNILDSTDNFVESILGVSYNSNEIYDTVSKNNKRKSTQCEMQATPNSFMYERINSIIKTFDYELVCDIFYYDVIKYKEGDFIWRHKDDNGERMFSIVAQLNDGDAYEGGNFKYWEDDIEFDMSKDIGTGMAFKAGVYHEVKPIIKGERYSFVSFVKFSDVKKIGKQALI